MSCDYDSWQLPFFHRFVVTMSPIKTATRPTRQCTNSNWWDTKHHIISINNYFNGRGGGCQIFNHEAGKIIQPGLFLKIHLTTIFDALADSKLKMILVTLTKGNKMICLGNIILCHAGSSSNFVFDELPVAKSEFVELSCSCSVKNTFHWMHLLNSFSLKASLSNSR